MSNEAPFFPDRCIACPRCGYDQRGVVVTWRDTCPLEGICAECGFGIFWPEVCNPKQFEPSWCVEFVRSRWHIPKSCCATVWHSLCPWNFWRRLRMAFAIHPSRLIVYAVLILIVPWLIVHGSIQTTLAVQVRRLVEADVKRLAVVAGNPTVKSLNLGLVVLQPPMDFNTHIRSPGESSLAQRIGDVQLQLDRVRRENDPTGDFSRDEIIAALEAEICRLQEIFAAQYPGLPVPGRASPRAPPAPHIQGSIWLAIFEAVMFPDRPVSLCSIQQGALLYCSYPPPASLQSLWSPGVARPLSRHALKFDRRGALLGAGTLWLAFPLSFVLLPASRRKAKVQWLHLFRIAIYSLALVSILQVIGAILWNAMWISDHSLYVLLWEYSIVFFWIALPIYWAVAIKHYLKMPHSKSISALLTIMIALLSMPLLQHVWPTALVNWVLGV